ncbi:MAG: hypothetical protein HY690_00720 [Chloroflexi bacterium]|nr:hypothetical protein [Chloroflexota bacterium]
MAKVLLKARPTEAQLADRLAPPRPDGLELYLDAADLADEAAMRGVLERLERQRLLADFCLIVEGPMRSLDGAFFHVARQSEADAEVVRRLVWLGQRLGAEAINLHPFAPEGPESLTLERRQAYLERSLPLLDLFARQATAAGMAPTVESMPAVLRMRQGGYFFSAVGMLPEDLRYWVERLPALRLCLDVSHTQLVVNAQHAAMQGGADDFPELYAFLHQAAPLGSVQEVLRRLAPLVLSAHLSNARGVLGEGLPYGEGDLDLDALVCELARCVSYLVTETLEADPDRALLMREAQERILRALEADRGG